MNGFSPNLVHVYALRMILWRSDLGMLMGKFHQFLTEFSTCHMSIFSFRDDNLSKYLSIFHELGMCNDIVDVWFRITNGQFLPIFDRVIYSSQDKGIIISCFYLETTV